MAVITFDIHHAELGRGINLDGMRETIIPWTPARARDPAGHAGIDHEARGERDVSFMVPIAFASIANVTRPEGIETPHGFPPDAAIETGIDIVNSERKILLIELIMRNKEVRAETGDVELYLRYRVRRCG
jgi:hypothetical protein